MGVCGAKIPILGECRLGFLVRLRQARIELENGFQRGIQVRSSNKVDRQLA